MLVAEADQAVGPNEIRHESRSREVCGYTMSVKHARSWQQACAMREFLTTIDDKVIESHHAQSQRLKFRVQTVERGWTWLNPRPAPTDQECLRANEVNTDECDSKRMKFEESRGQ